VGFVFQAVPPNFPVGFDGQGRQKIRSLTPDFLPSDVPGTLNNDFRRTTEGTCLGITLARKIVDRYWQYDIVKFVIVV
jgi:hypothetical protein